MLRLATPLALTELGWMLMGVVDTIMAGRLNTAAVGAGSLGNMLFYPIAICGTGMLLGMDTLVAQAFGAGDATRLPAQPGERIVACGGGFAADMRGSSDADPRIARLRA